MLAIWRNLLPWIAPVVAMATMSISLSLTIPLFALLLEREGVSGTMIGLNHTFSAAAMVISAPFLPRVLARVGVVPLMVWSTIALALGMVLIPLFSEPLWWAMLRPVFGFAGTALFFASEYWIVGQAPDRIRGRIIGFYVLILSISYMIGPLLLNVLGIEGYAIYLVPAGIFALAAVPLLLGRKFAPDGRTETTPKPFALLRFFRTDPMIIWGVVLFGVVEFGCMGLISVWGLRSGYPQEIAVSLVFWIACGSMIFQLPVGWAADRFDRRRLLGLAGAVAAASPFLLILYSTDIRLVVTGVFLMGGMAVAFYSLALVELGARYRGPQLAEGNAAVVLAYGIGALLSPSAFGAAMDVIPPDGLLWLASAAACAYCALAVVRMSRTRPRGVDTDGDFST